MLQNTSQILKSARECRFLVGGMNVVNMEMAQGVLRAAEEVQTPVIIQVWHGDLSHPGVECIASIVRLEATHHSIPIALQLDHGQSYDQAMTCIDAGFTSVMIDLANRTFEENIAETRRVVETAHKKGATVEAEIGQIFDGADTPEVRSSFLTDVDQAQKFVDETGIDQLAISIGTAHGRYSAPPKIDFALLTKIVGAIDIPIVVHGGSDIPERDILQIIESGAAKLNIGFDLMVGYLEGLKAGLGEMEEEPVVPMVMDAARNGVYQVAKEKMQLWNSIRVDRAAVR